MALYLPHLYGNNNCDDRLYFLNIQKNHGLATNRPPPNGRPPTGRHQPAATNRLATNRPVPPNAILHSSVVERRAVVIVL
jgi:hypothetical protein